MSEITYQDVLNGNRDVISVKVFLDGRRIGEIRSVVGGWRYVPKGTRVVDGCPVFGNLRSVKASLETEG